VSQPSRAGRRQRLSTLVIATPESRRLAPTLESIRDWADEVVVLDRSPQQAWKAVCRRYGVRWLGCDADADPLDAARRALYQTDGEWLLVLEADERIDYAAGGLLVRTLADRTDGPNEYALSIVDHLDGREPAAEHRAVRLVRKRAGYTFLPGLSTALAHRGRPLGATGAPLDMTIHRAPRVLDPGESVAGLPAPADDPELKLLVAAELIRRERHAEAEALLDELAAADGDTAARAVRNRAVLEWRGGRGESALARIDEWIAEHPGFDEIRRLKVLLLLADRRFDEALGLLESLLDLLGPEASPEERTALYTAVGRAEAGRGRLSEAEAWLLEAAALAPRSYDAHISRGELLESAGRTLDAVSAYLRAASLRPDLGAGRRRAGELLVALGRPEDGAALRHEADRVDASLDVFSSYIEESESTIPPETPFNPLAGLVDEINERRAAEEAEEEVARATGVVAGAEAAAAAEEPEPRPQAAGESANPLAAVEQEPPPAAVEEEPPLAASDTMAVLPIQEGGTGDVSDTPVLPGLSRLSDPLEPTLREQRRREDIAHLEEEVAKNPDNHEAQYDLGMAWFTLQDLPRAESALRQAVRQTGRPLPRPKLATAWCRLAECSLERGDLIQAIREARSALALDGTSTEARIVLGRIAWRQNHFHEAVQEFRRVLAADAGALTVDRGVVLRELGICLYRDGQYAESAEVFVKAAERLPGDAMIRLFLGNAYAHAGRVEEALVAFRDANRIDPTLPEVRNNLIVLTVEVGNRLYDQKRYDEVLNLVGGAPRTPEILFLSALTRQALGDREGARRDLEILNQLDDGFAEAHWNLALLCREAGDLAGAARALARFRHLAPHEPRGKALEQVLRTTREIASPGPPAH
jgi:tetratricopeptide (TPR) repeat protein